MIIDALAQRKLPFFAVCSYGRAGSTVIMKTLRAMGVHVVGDVPFEDRSAQLCLINWLMLLAGESPSIDIPRCFAGVEYRTSVIDKYSGSLQERLDQWLDSMITGQNDRLLGMAEKFIGFHLLRIWAAYRDLSQFRPIVLIRDPRDIFLSAKFFNAKRGYAGFNDSGDDDLFYRLIIEFQRELLRFQRRFGGVVVRYENLMSAPDSTLIELARLVGITPITVSLIDDLRDGMMQLSEGEMAHVSSASGERSVNRWRSHSDKRYSDIFTKKPEGLVELGYALDAR